MADMPDSPERGTISAEVFDLVKECEKYRTDMSADRRKAMEYSDGVMKDTPADENRSQVVSRDVRAVIKKIKPALVRTILGNDKIVEYQPVGEGDEAGADQATDYVNHIVLPESLGDQAIEDAADDALRLRNGIIRVYWQKKRSVSISTHTGLDQQALVQLVGDDSVEVLGKAERMEAIDTPEGPRPEPVFDVRIRRVAEYGCIGIEGVAPEEFLIHPDALDIGDSPLTGINKRMRRSELVAMGYDRALVDDLPVAGTDDSKDDEEFSRRRDWQGRDNPVARASQEVEYYELYARIDEDDDGIAELRRMVYLGAINDRYKVEDEETDDVPFADLVVERRPHQREGNSIPDDAMEIQRVKTVLLRQTLDNIYWQNNPQPAVQEGAIANPEAVLNPKFGQPIRINQGVDVREAIQINTVPFVAQQSFGMLDYLDNALMERTGVTDASSGLPPDALQNMTATATALLEQAGIGQTEQMVRTFARGLKRLFGIVLRMVIKHQDKPRTVRLRGQWVEFDPRQWNAAMDCTVNTGLGAGTRERDMAMMQFIGAQQEKLLGAFGPTNNPYVTPDNVWNALARGVEAAGLKTPEMYFTKPDPQQLQEMQQAAANRPDPAMEKVKAEQQAAAAKAQMDAQLEQQKLQNELQLEQQRLQQEGELKRYQIDQELALRRQQNAAQILTSEPVADARVGGMPG
jgi:hypothetical protein